MDKDSQHRFDAFAAKKIAEAGAALLPPLVTDFDRATAEFEAIGNEWSRRLFDGDFYLSPPPSASRPACSLVFVQSREGNTVTNDPSTLGGGKTDKHLIYEGLSQVAADAVLAGSKTILGTDIVFSVWHPELVRLRAALGKPRHPIQIIATLRGLDLDHYLLFNVPDIPVIVITCGSGASVMQSALAARPWIKPIVMEQPQDLPAAFEEFRRRGIVRVSAVGGRTLATELIDAGLVQDLYLTMSPKSGGEPGTPVHPRPLDSRRIILRKHGTGPETGVVFEHLRLQDSESAEART